MALFDLFKKRAVDDTTAEQAESTAETTSSEPSEQPLTDVLLKALLSGETITREQAMTVSAVSASVNFIANTIASMPVKLYRYSEGSHTVKNMDSDKRVELLNGDTGDTLDAFQMKKMLVMDYLMGNGGYAYISKHRNEVTALKYVPNDYVAPQIVNPDPLNKVYKLFVYTNEYDLWEFIKLLRNTQDGATGVGLTQEVSKALQTAYTTLMYQLFTVKTGGNKKGFLKSGRKLGQDELNKLQAAWRRLNANNTDNMMVLNNGIEFQEASNSSVDMQLNQNKQTLTNEIKSIFHIYDNDYYRTFKEAIYPIVKAFETALNRDLLLEREKKSYFFELDVKEILRVSIKERYEAYKLAKETGFMTPNEIREHENMERIEGMDVINVGLASVLYDINTHKYYTPNTDTLTDPSDGSAGNNEEGGEEEGESIMSDQEIMQDVENHELVDEAVSNLNLASLEKRSDDEDEDDTLDDESDDDGEIDKALDDLELELIGEIAERYASKYYDPVKAHEYYEAHKKLKNKTSTAQLNDKGKAAARYVKDKLKEAKNETIAKHKELMNSKIAALRDKYKNMSKEERKANREKIFAEIKSLRAANKATIKQIRELYNNKYIEELDKIKADKSFAKTKKK